ncbi:hypothetical protein ACWG8W_06490 [Citricoccus zhacaiensis]
MEFSDTPIALPLLAVIAISAIVGWTSRARKKTESADLAFRVMVIAMVVFAVLFMATNPETSLIDKMGGISALLLAGGAAVWFMPWNSVGPAKRARIARKKRRKDKAEKKELEKALELLAFHEEQAADRAAMEKVIARRTAEQADNSAPESASETAQEPLALDEAKPEREPQADLDARIEQAMAEARSQAIAEFEAARIEQAVAEARAQAVAELEAQYAKPEPSETSETAEPSEVR